MADLEDLIDVEFQTRKKLFPDPQAFGKRDDVLSRVKTTRESITSMTPRSVAWSISTQLYNFYNQVYRCPPETIIDATGNAGGNTISFASRFTNVVAFEIKSTTASVLKENIAEYGLSIPVHNRDFLTFLVRDKPEELRDLRPDIIFIDPPWYWNGRFNTNMCLDPNMAIPMNTILDLIWSFTTAGFVAVKVPARTRLSTAESRVFVYRQIDILVFVRPRTQSLLFKKRDS